MSRPSDPPSFAAFFPNAPRAAKDKAKEREKVMKSQKLESPTIKAVVDGKAGFILNGQNENIPPPRAGGDKSTHVNEPSAIQADDTESLQGDLLNGVGSASSHASSTSTVFSAVATANGTSRGGGSANTSSLTPLTNLDSSPNRVPSPTDGKAGVSASNLSHINTIAVAANDVLPTQSAPADQPTSTIRVYARDPNRVIKGEIATYDAALDMKLHEKDRRRGKVTYRQFGLVRIHNLRGASSCLSECLANGFSGR